VVSEEEMPESQTEMKYSHDRAAIAIDTAEEANQNRKTNILYIVWVVVRITYYKHIGRYTTVRQNGPGSYSPCL
jgi:hypothetical protein